MSASLAPEDDQGSVPTTGGRVHDPWPVKSVPPQSQDGGNQMSPSIGQSPSSSSEALLREASFSEDSPREVSSWHDSPRDEPRTQVRAFSLQPFALAAADLSLRLEGQLARQDDHLHITYQLSGDISSVVLPPPTTTAPSARADGLWQHTCFELFLAAEGEAPYWEVNLAPNGAWNLYRLATYRQGLAPVPDRDDLPFTVATSAGMLELTLDMLLPQELVEACRQRTLRLGVTAVIERQGGELSYWALAHGGMEADFHRREDFLLRLPPR